MTNEEFMKEAIDMAIDNVANGGGPFGAVIVKDGKVIGRGVNRVWGLLYNTRIRDKAMRSGSSALF